MIDKTLLKPGMIIVVRGTSWVSKLIEVGSVLRELPSASHIAVVTHQDAASTWWGKEGRPGGVGDADLTRYIRNPRSICNFEQPLEWSQQNQVVSTVKLLNGTPYDWRAIFEDTLLGLGLKDIWKEKINGLVPGHVVCSSLAAYAYDKAGAKAPSPNDYRHVFPADWTAFIESRGWQK